MRPRTCAIATILTLAPLAARAQPLGWSSRPDGEAQYTATYVTSGSFSCSQFAFFPGGSCAASGSTLTLGNNGAFLTLAFQGVAQNITADANRRATPILGAVAASVSGTGPFLFPANPVQGVPSFRLFLQVETTVPFAASAVCRYEYFIAAPVATTTTPRCIAGFGGSGADFIGLRTLPFRGYGSVVIDNWTPLTLQGTGGVSTIGAQIGIVPEPSTYALVALGLAGVGVVGRKRLKA